MDMLGIFRDVETAARAVDQLILEGFSEGQITSLSSTPYPDGVLVRTSRRTWFRWLALAGGLAGAAGGFALAAGTAWVYPVQTGDKAIVAFYPTGIISYELAMLFAIIGAMAGMFLEMRLPPWKSRPYDPAIAEGCIGICVSLHPGGGTVACTEAPQSGACIGIVASLPMEEQRRRAEGIMQQAGALRILAEETP